MTIGCTIINGKCASNILVIRLLSFKHLGLHCMLLLSQPLMIHFLIVHVYLLQCSIYPHCKKTPEQINFQLQEYYAQYGKPGTNYSCYVNSDGLAEVIREKRFQFSEVLHGVIWPIAVFVVSTASLVVTFRRRRCGNNT